MSRDHKRLTLQIVAALQGKPSTVREIAHESDINEETVRRTVLTMRDMELVRFVGFAKEQTTAYGHKVRRGGQFPALWEWNR